MCTLTVLAGEHGVWRLAMNRDERRRRGPATAPAVLDVAGSRVVAPRDSEAGGSWIVADQRRRAWCVLNGDRVAAGWREPEQAPSRGELPFALLAAGVDGAGQVAAWLRDRLAAGALRHRPFQLVLVERADAIARFEFDGEAITDERAAAPWIATSNGFDPRSAASGRRRQFEAWLSGGGSSGGLIAQLELHRSHVGAPKDGALASFCLHRPLVATRSVTAVDVGMVGVMMRHESGAPCRRAAASEVLLPCS
jgi:hypothetical protein